MSRMQLRERAKKMRTNFRPIPEKGSRFFKEFKEFAMKGNIVDLAVGIMIGTAFGKIVASLVNDIVMPPVVFLLGKVSISNYFFSLSGGEYKTVEEAKAAGASTINYGLFLNNILEFLIIAAATFLVVRQINRMRRGGKLPPSTRECPYCVTVIPTKAMRCPACTSNLTV